VSTFSNTPKGLLSKFQRLRLACGLPPPKEVDFARKVSATSPQLDGLKKRKIMVELLMKNIFFGALFLQLLVFGLMTPGLCANERREFISKTMNSEVRKLFKSSGKELIGAEPFSSKNNNTMDYMIGFYNTDYGLLVTLQTLKQRFDEGRAIPDVYNSELVAIVFVDKSLLWYESETAKVVLKAKMARLVGKQSI
jgi:hypothetical protein